MSFRLFRPRIAPRQRPAPFVWLPMDTPQSAVARQIAQVACQTSDPFTRASLNDLAPIVARLEISLAALSANPVREPEPAGVVL